MELALQPRALAEDHARDLEIDLGGLGAKHEGLDARGREHRNKGFGAFSSWSSLRHFWSTKSVKTYLTPETMATNWLVLCC